MLYRASTPISPDGSLLTRGFARKSLDRPETAYGLTSRLREADGTRRPTTPAASELFHSPRSVSDAGIRVRNDVSFFHRLMRPALNRQACSVPA